MAGADILHVDLDAFYASVEQLHRPELRGLPIAVGGGVVLACSYEAKRFGVRSGMSARVARAKCPALQIVEGHFSEYQDLSTRVFEICEDFTPLVERISIDEAFLDVRGTRHLFGPPGAIAAGIRRRVREEVGLPISAGVARTKFLAKIASQVAKPDGLVVVDPADELGFLHPLPVRLMWGVGPVTERRLAELGVATIGDLAVLPEATVRGRLGAGAGNHLIALSWNRDPRPVDRSRRSRSMSAQSAFGTADQRPERFDEVLLHLADRVATRLRRKDRAGRTVTVRVRFADMQAVTRSATTSMPVSGTVAIFEIARSLAGAALPDARGRPVGLFGIAVSNLVEGPYVQLELPFDEGEVTRPGTGAARRRLSLDRSVDAVRERFGRDAVGAASVLLGRRRGVPDEFRELAERD